MIGTGLWGVVTGLAIVKSGLSIDQAIGMSLLVFSGTAQLAALPLIVLGAPLMAIVTTAILVSLRFVIYSAIIARYFGNFPFFKRIGIGYFTIDAGLAAYTSQVDASWNAHEKIKFWAGCNLPIWLVWQVGSFIGFGLASVLPSSTAYAFIGLLAIMAMVPVLINDRATVACALASTVVAALGAVYGKGWPAGVATIAAVMAGALAGVMAGVTAGVTAATVPSGKSR